jgi:hypothetical protein
MYVDQATADYWVACGWGMVRRWNIILIKPLPLKLRDTSCSVRESTILAAASGSRYHRSLIQEAWGYEQQRAQHPIQRPVAIA